MPRNPLIQTWDAFHGSNPNWKSLLPTPWPLIKSLGSTLWDPQALRFPLIPDLRVILSLTWQPLSHVQGPPILYSHLDASLSLLASSHSQHINCQVWLTLSYFLGLQNHHRWWLQWWNLKTLTPRKKSYDQPRQHIKKQRHYFANKGPSSQSYGFSSSQVWMWELDYKESWVLKNWCLWAVVL